MTELIRALNSKRVAGVRALHVVLALALMVVLAFSVLASSRPPARLLVLEARGMAFYLPGGSQPNPTLELAAGEAVELVLVNRDAGMAHDLAVDSLGVATPIIQGKGATTRLVLEAPREPGVHDYVCTLHPVMMRGEIRVR